MTTVGVGILTYKTVHYNRVDLAIDTMKSLYDPPVQSVCLYNNSPQADPVEFNQRFLGLNVKDIWSDDGIQTCGRGMNYVISDVVKSGVDIVVFSNDDIYWKPGWYEKVVNFWENAPDDFLILSGLVCNKYWFNDPIETVEYGGTKALRRWSATGGTWTLRAKDWDKIYPVSELPNDDDVRTCHRIVEQGYKVAETPLTEHLGKDVSTWGNLGWNAGEPIDYAEWGLE